MAVSPRRVAAARPGELGRWGSKSTAPSLGVRACRPASLALACASAGRAGSGSNLSGSDFNTDQSGHGSVHLVPLIALQVRLGTALFQVQRPRGSQVKTSRLRVVLFGSSSAVEKWSFGESEWGKPPATQLPAAHRCGLPRRRWLALLSRIFERVAFFFDAP